MRDLKRNTHTHTHISPIRLKSNCVVLWFWYRETIKDEHKSVNKAVLDSTGRSFALLYSLHCLSFTMLEIKRDRKAKWHRQKKQLRFIIEA